MKSSEEPPTVLRPKKGLEVLDHLRAGETMVSAAAQIGYSHATLYDWGRTHPEWWLEVAEARAEGKRRRAAELSGVLFTGAGKADEDPRYTTQLIFALKNLSPEDYSDRHDVNVSGGIQHEHQAEDVERLLDDLAAQLPGPGPGEQSVLEGRIVAGEDGEADTVVIE